MSQLKLMALDNEDLLVISAAMQDAVMKIDDLDYSPADHHFSLMVNRFVWEKKAGRMNKTYERRRCHLVFKRVENVKFRGIDRQGKTDILSLLAIQFRQTGDGPGGDIELIMSADCGILLSVECIEMQLADMGGAWQTPFKPHHVM